MLRATEPENRIEAMHADAKTVAARGFVRSLNILLKFARLYEFGHPRTAAQFETAWKELRAALSAQSEAGLLLAASGSQLLLDGVPLESNATEQSFARLLSTAGISSIHFSPSVTKTGLGRFVRAFPVGGTNQTALGKQLIEAVEGEPGIHINGICYVPADSGMVQGNIAAQIAARAMSDNAEEYSSWFEDPQKLLQLIFAAEGSRGRSGEETGEGSGGSGLGGPGMDGTVGDGSGGTGNGGGDRAMGGPGGSLASGQGGPGPAGEQAGSGSGNGGGDRTMGGPGGSLASGQGGPGPAGEQAAGGSGAGRSGGLGPGSYWPGSSGGAGGSVGSATEADWGGSRPGGGRGTGRGPVQLGGWTSATAGMRTILPPRRASKGEPSEADILVACEGLMGIEEEEVRGIMRLLAQLAQTTRDLAKPPDAGAFQQRLSTLPVRAQITLRQALASVAAQLPTEKAGQPLLLKLAEHVAIRFAVESYERGDVRVDAVRELLTRMSEEIHTLRATLGVQEQKTGRSDRLEQGYSDILAQQFWAQVPDAKKEKVLLSPEAWCIPSRNVRQFVEDLLRREDAKTANEILENYASCMSKPDSQARRYTAIGLAELADLYALGDGHLLVPTIHALGAQLSTEQEPELQSLLSAAFVRLGQKAANTRDYPALHQVIASLDEVASGRPTLAQDLRPRVAVENRLPEFIEEGLRIQHIPEGLAQLLQRLPGPAADHLAKLFSRCEFSEDCDRLAEMARLIGPDGAAQLREAVRTGASAQVVATVGLLSRLEPDAVEELLPGRLSDWQRSAHDRVVRQLALSGSSERGRLLLAIFDALDAMVRPMAIDEIGMSGENSGAGRLVQLAEGDLPEESGAYLQLKAIEALGRLRTPAAAALLRKIVESKQLWRWVHPNELRIVAAQALSRLDPEWARDFLPQSGLDPAELSLLPLDPDPEASCSRQRRYPRLQLAHPVIGATTNLRENSRLEVEVMNLAGAAAICDQHLAAGTLVSLKLNTSLRPVRAQAFVRDTATEAKAFEVADIDLEERSKLRRLLVQLGAPLQASPGSRRRRREEVVLAQG